MQVGGYGCVETSGTVRRMGLPLTNTARTCSIQLMSSSGSPATARISASLPIEIVPLRSINTASFGRDGGVCSEGFGVGHSEGRKAAYAVTQDVVRFVRPDTSIGPADDSRSCPVQRSVVRLDRLQPLGDGGKARCRSRKCAAGDRHDRLATAKLGDDLRVSFDAIGGEERAVFDTVDAGCHGIGDALASVSMSRDLAALPRARQ